MLFFVFFNTFWVGFQELPEDSAKSLPIVQERNWRLYGYILKLRFKKTIHLFNLLI